MASDRVQKVIEEPERVISGDIGWPGDGYVNADADALVSAVTDLAAIPDDDERDILVRPWTELAMLVGQGIRLHVKAQDQRYALLNSDVAKMWQVQADTAAAKSVSPYGNASGQDYENKVSAARDASRREQEQAAGDKVAGDLQAKADDLGQKATAKAEEADDAIRGAIARVEAPLSLKSDVTLEDLARQERCRQEIISWGPQECMKKALVQVRRAIQQEDEAILRNLIPATIAAANEILKTPPGKLAALAGAYGNGSARFNSNGDDPQTQAVKLLDEIAQYRESQRPPSIAAVIAIRKRIMIVYSNVFGSTQDLESSYQYVDGDASSKGPSWDVDDEWVKKYLRPGLRMPGWSRVVIAGQKSADGRLTTAPSREPKL
jgi:hypothetical protein